MVQESVYLRYSSSMGHKLFLSLAAEKELKKLPKKDRARILESCILLEAGETNLDIKKLHQPLDGYRLRVGKFRLLYVLEGKGLIVVHAIKRRKDAYR